MFYVIHMGRTGIKELIEFVNRGFSVSHHPRGASKISHNTADDN